MSTYRVIFKAKDGSRQVVVLQAKDREEAKQRAVESQQRRHQRFPLTFARLDASLDAGRLDPMIAASPGQRSRVFTKEMHRVQTELRKKDQARYDDGSLKVESVTEVK